MSAAFILTGLFILTEFKKTAVGLVVLLSTVLVRQDNLVLLIPLSAAILFFDDRTVERRLVAAFLFLFMALALFFVSGKLANARPWWIVFKFTTQGMPALVDKIDPAFDIKLYWDILFRDVKGLWGSDLFLNIGLGIFGIWFGFKSANSFRPSRPTILMAVILFAMIARYLILPRFWHRHYAGLMTATELLLITLAIDAVNFKKNIKSATPS
jgi:hypothetical protein